MRIYQPYSEDILSLMRREPESTSLFRYMVSVLAESRSMASGETGQISVIVSRDSVYLIQILHIMADNQAPGRGQCETL